ncbi:MAG: hypothetical protein R6V39_07180 [Desulfovibrionales bacterium]
MSEYKQLTLRVPESSIEQLDEMVQYFDSRSRNALVKDIIEAAYEDYKMSASGEQTVYEMLAEMQVNIGDHERRLAELESKKGSTPPPQASRRHSEPQKISESAKTSESTQKASSAESKPVTTAGKNFKPDEIMQMLQNKPKDWSDEKLAEEMNKKGLTTAFGKPCSTKAIHKWRHKLKHEGTI